MLTIKTKITKYCFCKTATENICILPKKADVGGKPIIASAPMQNASPEAQEMYAKNNHEYPILASAPLSAQLLEWEKSGVKLDQSPLENLVPHMDLAVKIADEEGWR